MDKNTVVILILFIITSILLLYIILNRPKFILNMLKNIHTGRFTLYENGKLIIDVQGKNLGQHGIINVANLKIFLNKVAKGGEVAVGEMYMDGLWKSPDIIALIALFIENQDVLIPNKPLELGKDFNTDKENISDHYDAGNDFYMSFLKDSMHAYGCGFWINDKDTLETAQLNKVNRIIKKMETQKGQRILDIGSGWGYIGNYISQQTGCIVDGISISEEQLKFMKDNLKNINGIFMHYMNLPQTPIYDKAYSIEMMEHVRCVNYLDFFTKIYGCMKPGGRFVLHTITYNIPKNYQCNKQNISFVNKHIFNNGQIATLEWIISAATKAGFRTNHVEAYGGQHYYKTLKAWRDNLLSEYDNIIKMGYTDKIIRKYEYYFTSCAAAFMTDGLNITQFVFDKTPYLNESVTNKF